MNEKIRKKSALKFRAEFSFRNFLIVNRDSSPQDLYKMTLTAAAYGRRTRDKKGKKNCRIVIGLY